MGGPHLDQRRGLQGLRNGPTNRFSQTLVENW